ncbi:MAG: transglutaminase domain-containing protein [Myxococcota bacterium]
MTTASASNTLGVGRGELSHVTPSESLPAQIVKAVMYEAAFLLMFWSLATTAGLVALSCAIVFGSFLAQRAFSASMRPLAVALIGVAVAALCIFLSWVVRDTTWIAMALGVNGTIYLSDVLLFGLGFGGILFTVRYLAKKSRPVGAVEVIIIAFAVVYVFIDHRNYNLNHPRGFSDLALSEGFDPTVLLRAFGVAIAVFSMIMLLRRSGGVKTALSMIVALAVGVGVYFILEDRKPPQPKTLPTSALLGDGDDKAKPDDQDTDGDGIPDKDDPDADGDGKPDDEDGDGKPDKGPNSKGGGGGGGNSNNPYSKSFSPPNPPQPVAVVTFHDDFESDEGVLYFRQNVLSTFDQTHLAADTTGTWDQDVITKYPTTGPVDAAPEQNVATHTKVPTSMFLLADHPQPVALSHASELRPLENPNPNLFVAAYEVTSETLSVDYERLLGRKSVPSTWDEKTKKHYLDYPDDPRYLALSDQIVRDLDPRFQDDDLMKAYAIKRYLEKNGYYTLKEKITSEEDPTAAFLFGSMRGYCVHFAHSAVFLFRSQGIAARVAVGYGVDTKKRGSGSSMLILGNQAHAWPEIHLDGIGWVTFDVYPEQSDEPPQQIVDQDLANMLGEIARKDPSGGQKADPNAKGFDFSIILWVLIALVGAALVAAYVVKITRRLLPVLGAGTGAHRWAMVGTMDRFADLGERRAFGETLEGFARRMAGVAPSLEPLTMEHLKRSLGHRAERTDPSAVRALYRQTAGEVRKNVPWHRRLGAALNPLGWLLSR